MKRHLLILYVLQALILAAAFVAWTQVRSSRSEMAESDSRGCYLKGGDGGPCIASFSNVQLMSENFNGKRVILVGYFALRYGVPVLYATKDDYLNDVPTSALAVVGSYEDLTSLFKTYGNRYVRLEASFQVVDSKKKVAWVGELAPPFRASHPAPPPVQTVKDLLVPVEYMR